MGLFEISSGKNYDLTKVSGESLDIEEVAKNNKKLIDIFKKFDMDKNNKLDAIELAKVMDYFSSFDKDMEGDGAGVISKEELKAGLLEMNKELGLNKQDEIGEKDVENFIKKIVKASKGNDTINVEYFQKIANDNPDLNLQNIAKSEVIKTENGNKFIITYSNGTEVTVNPDKTYEIKTKTSDKCSQTSFYSENHILTQKIIQDNDNNLQTTNYGYNKEDGSYPIETISLLNNGKTRSVLKYYKGKPNFETVTEGLTEKQYEYSENTPILLQTTQNLGRKDEFVTIYSSNDNGTVTATCMQQGKTTTTILSGTQKNSRKIKETIIEQTSNGEKSTETIYLVDGYVEQVTLPNHDKITTVYNNQNYKLSQTKTLDGTTYCAEYDGKGNTKGVYVKFGETPKQIADLANCSVQDIFSFNLEKIIGKGNKQCFNVGEELLIPGELDPENALLYRNPDYEKNKYQLWDNEQKTMQQFAQDELKQREQSLPRSIKSGISKYFELAKWLYNQEGIENPNKYQIQTRVEELKLLNPDLKDGELLNKTLIVKYSPSKDIEIANNNITGFRNNYKKKVAAETAKGNVIAQGLYEYCDKHIAAVGDKVFDNYFNQINVENIVGVFEEYDKISPKESLMEVIWDETGNSAKNRNEYQLKLVDMLTKRAEKSGVNADNIEQFNIQMKKLILKQESLGAIFDDPTGEEIDHQIRELCKKIKLAESTSPEELNRTRFEKNSLAASAVTAMKSQTSTANAVLKYQDDKDGWCADLWHGLKYVVTAGKGRNLRGNVEKDIEQYEQIMTTLKNAYNRGGEAEFIKAFEKEFAPQKFDKNLAEAYSTKLRNYTQAQALSSMYTKITKSLPDGTSVCNYNGLKTSYKTFLQMTYPDLKDDELNRLLEETIKQKMEQKGRKYTEDYSQDKFICLHGVVDEILSELRNQMQIYTDGKSLKECEEDLNNNASALFGAKHDIVNRVNKYAASQQAGDIYISTGMKVALMVFAGLCTGGWGASAGFTFLASTGVDMSNDLSRNERYTDEQFFDTLKNAGVDAVFAGGATYVRDTVKTFSLIKKAGTITKVGVNTSIDTGVGSTKLGLTGNFTPENFLYYLAFSAVAHGTSSKMPSVGKINKSNTARGLRRTINGGNKERNASNHINSNENKPDDNLFGVNLSNKDDVHNATLVAISKINNLGELNALKRNLAILKQDFPAEKSQEIQQAILARQNELISNPDLIARQVTVIDENIKNSAVTALNSPMEHFTPDQLQDISLYINSIQDKNTLLNVYEKLKKHGITHDVNNQIFCLLDDKFAELNLKRPYILPNDLA